MTVDSVQFVCYRESPIPRLSPLARAVLNVLKDARGIFRTHGMSVEEILVACAPWVRVSDASIPRARGHVARACEELVAKGLATETEGRWRRGEAEFCRPCLVAAGHPYEPQGEL